jgi:hypothetical protein
MGLRITRPDMDWATHGGAELDLLVVRGRRRCGFEFERTSAPEEAARYRAMRPGG